MVGMRDRRGKSALAGGRVPADLAAMGEDRNGDLPRVTRDPARFGALLPPRGALLGLDPGPKRVGVAVTDPGRRLVTPLETLPRRDELRLRERLRALVRARGAVGLVVGHPVSMDGRIGPAAEAAEALAADLAAVLGLPVLLQDERLSTFAVEAALREGRFRPRRRERGGPLDHYAAAVILEDALVALARLSRSAPVPDDGRR